MAICETQVCREQGAVLQLSAEVLLHFFHVKPPGRKSRGGSQTLLVCPFVSVLKELNTPNIQSLHMEKVVLVLVLQTVTSSCAEQGCS